ncbi:hypothetical protein B2J93_2513 [Marssonina coronariae]|uniref:Uncharacterized protein n=1 Tax=Diplocarpon coronariae TaxID=2795749 RepID=A0A218ZG71_9HELO|nr:hypothetical protein B2J93_2513 [Marssonina coronariae]
MGIDGLRSSAAANGDGRPSSRWRPGGSGRPVFPGFLATPRVRKAIRPWPPQESWSPLHGQGGTGKDDPPISAEAWHVLPGPRPAHESFRASSSQRMGAARVGAAARCKGECVVDGDVGVIWDATRRPSATLAGTAAGVWRVVRL